MRSLTFEPLLPPVAWVTLAVIAVVLWIVYARSRPTQISGRNWLLVMSLTAAAIATVLIVLLNPIWLEALPPPAGKPLLTVLVDESVSMQTSVDQGNGSESRFVRASSAVAEMSEELKQKFEIRLRTFAEESRPISAAELTNVQPNGAATDLSTPLLDALVSDRPQGQAVLVVSDGIHNATADAAEAVTAAETAKAWDAPVYTTTVGSDVQVNDLETRMVRSQELAFVGQSIPVSVELKQFGSIGDRVDVTLTDSDGVETTQEVRIATNATSEAQFLITAPNTGLFQYQVRAAVLPGEAADSNNATSFQVRVVDKPVKALVLEGKPYWDAKFLLRMLTEDPSLEVDCIVRVTGERYLWRKLKLVDAVGEPDNSANSEPADGNDETPKDDGPRFQRQEEMEFVEDVEEILKDPKRLADYQILLLGRESEAFLTDEAVDNVRQWIAQTGGSLVCYRGAPVAQPSQQLSRLLPVRWAAGRNAGNADRFRIQVTERGDNLSWLRIGGREGLAKLPSLAPSGATESIKPLAIVLGKGKDASRNSPALTYQPYGTGKVVVVEGSGMWRWAFLAPEYREMESAYGTLWQSLLRWLISSGGLLPGEDVALQMDRVTFTEGESVSAVVLRRADLDSVKPPTVRLKDSEEDLQQSIVPVPVGEELGVYQVFIGKLEAGHYQVELDATEEGQTVTKIVHFDVRRDLREQLEVSARSDLMARISEVSGGEVLETDNLGSLADKFQEHFEASRPVQYRRQTAWDRWWVLSSMIVVWGASWGIRRRSGLV